MEDNTTQNPQPQTIIIEREPQQKNGLGLAGFILSLLGLFLDWIPVLGWLIWLLGAIFSIIGLFKEPRGFAIAGTYHYQFSWPYRSPACSRRICCGGRVIAVAYGPERSNRCAAFGTTVPG